MMAMRFGTQRPRVCHTSIYRQVHDLCRDAAQKKNPYILKTASFHMRQRLTSGYPLGIFGTCLSDSLVTNATNRWELLLDAAQLEML